MKGKSFNRVSKGDERRAESWERYLSEYGDNRPEFKDRSKYQPHQGERELERRRKQYEKH